MPKLAFSTVACPDWTLEQVFETLGRLPFDGVELRTFSGGSARFACDPELTDTSKLRAMVSNGGGQVSSLGSSLRFDEPVWPPAPLGFVIGDYERPVREAKPVIEMASEIGAPLVRVFGFEGRHGESRKTLVRRVVDRLELVVDHARHTGVSVALENSGDFARAEQVMEVIERVNSPLLGACCSLSATWAARQDPEDALRIYGNKLYLARIKDLFKGRPRPLGDGELPCAAFTAALVQRRYTGWLVYEWDRAWLPTLTPAEEILPQAAATLAGWVSASRSEAEQEAGAAV